MHVYDIGYLGSMIGCLPEPENQYTENGFINKEWRFTTDANDHFVFIKREPASKKDSVFIFLDSLLELFDTIILDNAKRIFFYLNKIDDFKIKGLAPSTLSLCSIYLSLKIMGMEDKFYDNTYQIFSIVDRIRNKNGSRNSLVSRRGHIINTSKTAECMIENELNEIKELCELYE